ncbi:MAG: DNA-processing protein DprA [Maricaulaceae bacterium]
MSPRELSEAERLDWLRLARTRRVGPVTFAELIKRYREPAKAIAALPNLARRGGGKVGTIPSVDAARAEMNACEEAGARVLMSCEPTFPALLRAVDPPPPVISVIGDVNRLTDPCVAIVGARNASAIGRRFAQDVAAELGAMGYVVVSGLARGVDGAAHQGALRTGTAAVVAGGVDHVYPPEHEELRARIAESGAIVSENAPGYAPSARDFPRRNRLISGLSLGVVVIEAAARSGSLITARCAAEQGREVMAAPGSPLDPRAKGSNQLIRDGASLVESAEDIRDVLEGASLRSAREREGGAYEDPPVDEQHLEAEADRVREKVLELLSPTPTPRDEIIRYADASASAVVAALVELELAGSAVMLPGGLVALGAPASR